MELSVEAQRAGDAGGGLRIYVIEAGAHAKVAHVSTQRIKLSLNPSLPETMPVAELAEPAAQPETPMTSALWPWLFHDRLTGLNAEYFLKSADGSDNYKVTVAPHGGGDRTGVRVETPDISAHPEQPGSIDG